MNAFAHGVPFEQGAPPIFVPGGQQQLYNRGFGAARARGVRGFRGGRSRGWGQRDDVGDLIDAAASAEARSAERIVDNTIANPAFWATVFNTLQHHPNVAEEIRRDLEEQERRAARARGDGSNDSSRRRRDSGRDEGPQERREGDEPEEDVVADEERPEQRTTADDLPDMYGYLTDDLNNIRHTVGVQRLEVLLNELDIDALWSARDVMISFGPLSRVLLRLFIGPYATDEEKLIVRMLNLAVERASRNFGFEDYRAASDSRNVEPFAVTYRRRGRMLRDFAAFRYMLEITENMGRIGRKHKNDLILLYLTLTTPEIRLHRKWNTEDRENVLAFRDRVTGYAITTPLAMARPMTIEMELDSVFGNVSANSRLLERSLSAALNNRNRKPNGLSSAQEVETLMENARLLDLSNGDTNAMRSALKPFPLEREHEALRRMLEMSAVVSMMAEEFRVFVAGAPPSRTSDGDSGPSSRMSTQHKRQQTRQTNMFRRPLFFTFKPATRGSMKK